MAPGGVGRSRRGEEQEFTLVTALRDTVHGYDVYHVEEGNDPLPGRTHNTDRHRSSEATGSVRLHHDGEQKEEHSRGMVGGDPQVAHHVAWDGDEHRHERFSPFTSLLIDTQICRVFCHKDLQQFREQRPGRSSGRTHYVCLIEQTHELTAMKHWRTFTRTHIGMQVGRQGYCGSIELSRRNP